MPRKPSSRNGYSVTAGRGNKKTYLLFRLRRDHPRILQALERGEYRSVRAAAIAASVIKIASNLDKLKRAWKRATAAERTAFLAFAREGDAAAERGARRAREARKAELQRKAIESLPPEEQRELIEEAEREAIEAAKRPAKK